MKEKRDSEEDGSRKDDQKPQKLRRACTGSISMKKNKSRIREKRKEKEK